MKDLRIQKGQCRTRVQFCAVNAIEIAGQVFRPDAATAYVEFFLSHSFPVSLDNPKGPYFTTIHPQTVANSFHSLRGKMVNLAHLVRSYNPRQNPRDRILGTVMAVEFPTAPEVGWRVQGDPVLAPGIRAVAALHKNAEGVMEVLETWAEGKTPYGEDTEWTVSMENESHVDQGGFLVRLKVEGGRQNPSELEIYWAKTPEDFKTLGWCYVPYPDASDRLLECLPNDGVLRIAQKYLGLETLFLNGGLNGEIFYYGVALTPEGRETAARVSQILASHTELVDLSAPFDALKHFAEAFTK
ncbi:MAG: hypothetical protein ABSE16_01630 [Verrucomicrobiota bacterium]|jgi:hypothetical protein